jgi:endonuclease I
MWHAFCREESTIRDNHRKETCTKWGATYNSPEYEEHQQQWKNHYAWQQERGTYEEMFVKLHNLVPVEVTELHLDY